MLLHLTVAAMTLIASELAPAPERSTRVEAHAPAPIRFTLLVMDHFSDREMIGAVRRTTGATHTNYIAVTRSGLTPEFIVLLARELSRSVEHRGETPLKPISMYFKKKRKHVPISTAERTWASTLIAQSALAPTTDFGKLGKHQAALATYTPNSSAATTLGAGRPAPRPLPKS